MFLGLISAWRKEYIEYSHLNIYAPLHSVPFLFLFLIGKIRLLGSSIAWEGDQGVWSWEREAEGSQMEGTWYCIGTTKGEVHSASIWQIRLSK